MLFCFAICNQPSLLVASVRSPQLCLAREICSFGGSANFTAPGVTAVVRTDIFVPSLHSLTAVLAEAQEHEPQTGRLETKSDKTIRAHWVLELRETGCVLKLRGC